MTPDLAGVASLLPGYGVTDLKKLHGDGSDRAYWRICTGTGTLILLVGPRRDENDAWVRLARHLKASNVRVPEIHAYDAERGWVAMEDLGDHSLYTVVKSSSDPRPHYRQVLEILVRMQVDGAKNFNLAVGFSPTPYDAAVMVEEEGRYFVREFAVGLLKMTPDLAALDEEFHAMAGTAATAGADYFLHRDFQSRNVHRAPDGWALIDFQGARPGPLAYDAAALILDPYVALPAHTRRELSDHYTALLASRGVDVERFRQTWPLIASFRLLQALGAFAKLGGRFGKPGFLEHAAAAFRHLEELGGDPLMAPYPVLRETIAEAGGLWATQSLTAPPPLGYQVK